MFSPIPILGDVPELVDGRQRKIGGQLRQWLKQRLSPIQSSTVTLVLAHTIAAPLYGPSISIDLSQGGVQKVVVTNNTAFTIGPVKNPTSLVDWTLVIQNSAGVALGAVTFDASIHQTGFTAPGAALRTSARFYLDGGTSYQISPWTPAL